MKKIGVVILSVVFLGLGYGYFQYNKPHRDIASEKIDVEVTAIDLFEIYAMNEQEANQKYLNKVIAVSGTVLELISNNNNQMVVLETNDDFGTINAQFDNQELLKKVKVGSSILVKGHCTGGDGLGVVITHCSILN